MTLPLLVTKLYIPRLPVRAVARPELIERLDQGALGQFTLISAPAGFGKTTLLTQWLADRQEGVAWISLDDGDNDLRRFLAYLAAALQQVGIELDEALLNPSLKPDELAPGALGTTILNKIVQSKAEIILVFDDYHVITRKHVHDLVAFFLQHMPPNLRLIIATRADPPLPLGKLRASGEMTEIRVDALRFEEAQAMSYLNQVQGLQIPSEDAWKLLQRTEGWIAGLQLASLALKHVKDPRDFVERFSGSHAYIAEYLTDEVIDGLTPALQDFLLSTSLLERFCAELCDAVREASDSLAMLHELKETNSFLIALDDENIWFRYHGLFADMLRKRAASSDTLMKEQVYQRASAWFKAQDLHPEAIDMALRGYAFDQALDLAEQVVESLVQRGELDTIMSWADQLPRAMVPTRPLFALIIAWIHLVRQGDTAVADSILKHLAPEDQSMQGKIYAIQSVHAIFLLADPAASEAHARKALALMPLQDNFFRSMALWNLSAACYLQGKHAEGLEALHETVESGRRSGNLLLAVTALCRIGSVAMQAGDLAQARRIFDEALALSRDDEGYVLPATFAAKLGLGKIFWEWNQTDAAYEQVQDALEKSVAWNASYAIEAYDTLASLQAFSGDPTSARASLEKARKLADETEITRLDDAYIASQQVLLELRRGNIAAASGWASRKAFDRSLHGGDDAERTLGAGIMRTYELMVFARYLLAEKRAGDAQLILDGLDVDGNELLPMAKRVEYSILQALVNSSLDQAAQASARLQDALELARPGSYMRPFLEEGPPLYALLKRLKKHPATQPYLMQLLEAFEQLGLGVGTEAQVSKAVEPLTKREKEVLSYMQSDLTVPEIAGELFIAESTVRTHIKNLYGKLDAHSRHEALTRARELGFL